MSFDAQYPRVINLQVWADTPSYSDDGGFQSAVIDFPLSFVELRALVSTLQSALDSLGERQRSLLDSDEIDFERRVPGEGEA